MEAQSSSRLAPSLAPEHDWTAARRVIHPALKPTGTHGSDGHDLRPLTNGSPGLPLVRQGPAGLPIAYVIPGIGFDVMVGIDHLLSWGVGPDEVHRVAMENLAKWSENTAWAEEVDGRRHIIWSDWGQGMDAARILLAEVRARLSRELGRRGRILVGMPERDLLIATTLEDGDEEFVNMFADYLTDHSRGSDEPVDHRLFELVDEELVPFRVLTPA